MNPRKGNFVFVGGTQGIGKAVAMEAARAGCAILLVARDPIAGQAAVEEMKVAGAVEASFHSADLSTIAGMAAVGDMIAAWKPQLHGLMHSAMCAFSQKTITSDGLELAFALQYFARAVINRKAKDVLAASGDGRIVHLAGAVPYKIAKPVMDDLQYEHRKWSFFKAILSTHVMGFMFLDQASRRWADASVRLYATGVNTTKTKVMADPDMHWIMRLMANFGTKPETSAQNAVRLLLSSQSPEPRAGLLKHAGKYVISPFDHPQEEAERLWDTTTTLAAKYGVVLQ